MIMSYNSLLIENAISLSLSFILCTPRWWLVNSELFYGELHLNYLPTPTKKATLIKMLN